ncbi:MAG: hypothetical protein HDR35_06750 [Treponema sp.]|nr:hypothetical protein [Treponema sp.]
MQKAFNSSVHPRDEHGRFTEKGIMELTEEERKELLDYLESEEYEWRDGFHISKRKIEAINAGRYKTEMAMCKILADRGFDVYLLDENYTKGKKADTFFKKDCKRDFLELKDTSHDVTRQYNRSVEQARNCFISVKGYVSPSQMKSLKEAVAKNASADEVYLYIGAEDKFLQIKKTAQKEPF